MITADVAIQTIRTEAAQRCDAKPRTPHLSAGNRVRQGDLYIWAIPAVPKNAKQMNPVRLQLAPGDTQGSRHVLDSDVGVKMYTIPNANPLQGPILELTKARIVTHPEHGHIELAPGVYFVTYQRAFADELRRQRD